MHPCAVENQKMLLGPYSSTLGSRAQQFTGIRVADEARERRSSLLPYRRTCRKTVFAEREMSSDDSEGRGIEMSQFEVRLDACRVSFYVQNARAPRAARVDSPPSPPARRTCRARASTRAFAGAQAHSHVRHPSNPTPGARRISLSSPEALVGRRVWRA